ncbi:phage major capsid protein [Streptomyces sp.]|uniref:phage major capsid protein n=1 Tax=Streptomyces sp. TaxID=1931 RepID=UPI002F40F24A
MPRRADACRVHQASPGTPPQRVGADQGPARWRRGRKARPDGRGRADLHPAQRGPRPDRRPREGPGRGRAARRRRRGRVRRTAGQARRRPQEARRHLRAAAGVLHRRVRAAQVRGPPGRHHPARLPDLSKLTAAAGANTVPISFYNRLVEHMIEVSGVLQTLLRTASGEQIQVPKTTAHSSPSGAPIAEAGTLASSDPTFGQVPLDAYKYGILLQISHELLNDTGVDLAGYLARQAERALGNWLGGRLVVGTGTNQPNGVVTAATVGKTGGAGVAGMFTGDDLIDLFYSVIAPYRNSSSCAWMMKDSSIAGLRKIKDTTGQYLWAPGLTAGAPDTVLGKPLVTDPNVAAVALSAKSVVFGDFSTYFVRQVETLRFERSDDYAFNTDLVSYRAVVRADGDLVDTTGSIKVFQGNAA